MPIQINFEFALSQANIVEIIGNTEVRRALCFFAQTSIDSYR